MRLSPVLITLLSFFFGCAHAPRDTSHLFSEDVTVMGHRGARGLAPENTMAAFDAAAALGVPFELDTRLCASGELVVIHDADVARITPGQGLIAELSLTGITALDAGSHFHASFAGEPIPTLAAVLQAHAADVVINIEVKSEKGTDNSTIADKLVALLEEQDLAHRVVVTSFSPFLLEQIRLRNPDIIRGQIYGSFKDSDLKWYEKMALRHLAFNKRAMPDMLMMEHVLAKKRYLRRMHRKGYRLFVWTVNDPEQARDLIERGVDGLITDRPDILLPIR